MNRILKSHFLRLLKDLLLTAGDKTCLASTVSCDSTVWVLWLCTWLLEGIVSRQPGQVAPEELHGDGLLGEFYFCIALLARCALAVVIILPFLCLSLAALLLSKVLLIDVRVVVDVLAHRVAVLWADVLVLNQRCRCRQAVLGVRALSLLIACCLLVGP